MGGHDQGVTNPKKACVIGHEFNVCVVQLAIMGIPQGAYVRHVVLTGLISKRVQFHEAMSPSAFVLDFTTALISLRTPRARLCVRRVDPSRSWRMQGV